MLTLLSWNVNKQDLCAEVTESGAQIALLQEAPRPQKGSIVEVVPGFDDEWSTGGWTRQLRTGVVSLDPEVQLRPRSISETPEPEPGSLQVSRAGTITVADVMRGGETLVTVASVYAAWETPPGRDRPLFADASAHRLLSDLAPLVTGSKREKLIVAGDLNLLHGYGEHGDKYWGRRYATVFERAEAMGLHFVGPQAPHGRQASPWPEELPEQSRDVPTFRHSRQTPASATRQLDFVFATRAISERLQVEALNGVDEWGPSDHCRILIRADL